MSSVPNFQHIGHFPWCKTSATDPGGSWDYVTLTASGGDEGLAEARRIWWDLESCVFTPEATLTDDDGSVNLSEVFGTQAIGTPTALTLSGAVGSSAGSPPVITIRPPRERVCEDTRVIMASFASFSNPGITEEGEVSLQLAYVSSEWRLYYRFFFFGMLTTSSTEVNILNPSNGGSDVGGTFSLFGYDFDWSFNAIADGGEITDIGLSATSGFFTYTA